MHISIKTTVNKKYFLALLFSILFALFISLVPWTDLRSTPYYDRENYVYFMDSVVNKTYWFDFDGLLTKLVNEWGWHKFLLFTTETLDLSSGPIIFFITFLSVFTASIFLSKRYSTASILLLISPLYVDFVASQLRLAFAMSIIFIAYYFYRKKNLLYIPILATTPFIHTSAVLFIFIIGVSLIISNIKNIPAQIKTVISVIVGFVVAVVTGPLMASILTNLEDRRAEYNDMSSPLLYIAFWLIIYLYLLIKGLFENQNKSFSFYIAISILSIVFLNTIMSGYSSRFLAACFPFIIAALIEVKGKEKSIIFASYAGYSALLWYFWFT
ncbi:EpsG family protein [Acinetobacter johnsonii]|uniref:EpsG family protein n=1 Tax=Acinetobacter johnsonii TaxID=40214 RepID=UPI0013306FC4|nr:EpsG family protein [Acinetobacter johnsonii]